MLETLDVIVVTEAVEEVCGNTPFLLYMYHPAKEPGHNEENTEAGKGRNRGSKQEIRELRKEP